MANMANGYVFGAAEQVTTGKIDLMFSQGTVTGIVNADISDNTILAAKIQSISGATFTALASIPSGAGVIPEANMPTFAAINIDGGAIDAVTLGANSQVTITDADINGGSLDGVIIGAASAAAITGTVVEAGTSLAITGTGDDAVVVTGNKR